MSPEYAFFFRERKRRQNNLFSVEISREHGKFVITVYRKPNFSDVYTHFENFLPSTPKFGMSYTLLYTCLTLCSDWKKFQL